mgnify:CR=1 FL=1
MPCAAGVEPYLAQEVATLLNRPLHQVHAARAGVSLQASWREVLMLNLDRKSTRLNSSHT